MWQYIIPAAAAVGGALLNKMSSDKAGERNAELQREVGQNSLSWRVADAREAGLHPLAALGAQLPSASPAWSVGDVGGPIAQAGQQIGDLVDRQSSPERRLVNLQAKVLEAQAAKDFAQAQYWSSEAARDKNTNNNSRGLSSPGGVDIQPIRASHVIGQNLDPVPQGLVSGKAHEVTSSRPGQPYTAAGRNPGWAESIVDVLPDGRKLVIATPMNEEGWSEGKESAGLGDYPLMIRQSAQASGMSVSEWLQYYLLGSTPLSDWDRLGRAARSSISGAWQEWRRENFLRKQAQQPR